MDPHSRLSQFNQRPPKSGPQRTQSRQMEIKTPLLPLSNYPRKAAAESTGLKTPGIGGLRVISTNSRIRRDEKYKKDMYLAFVNNALKQKAEGNTEHYDDLVSQFNLRNSNTSVNGVNGQTSLRHWVLALAHVVSQLDRTYVSLVEMIVDMPWTVMDSAFVKSYISFVGMLLSARPEYLMLVLEKTVKGLTYESRLNVLDVPIAESSSTPVTRRSVYERLHNMLQHLSSLFPTLSSTLHPLLIRNFPHKRLNKVAQVTYIRNLLRICEYRSELSDRILDLIVDRTLQIDVEIQVDLEELEAAEPSEHVSEDIFALDPFDTLVGQDGDESDSDSDDDEDGDDGFSDVSSDAGDIPFDEIAPQIAASTLDVKHVRDMMEKLDAILTLLFQHLTKPKLDPQRGSNSSSTQPSTPPLEEPSIRQGEGEHRRAQFITLLYIFERSIIRTFRSRYTQFLVFWYTSLDAEFADIFQGVLLGKALLEQDQPAVTRSAAASYIGSFVSRAQFIDRDSTRKVLHLMSEFLANHMDVYEAWLQRPTQQQSQSTAEHTVFYAVAQSLFLIFCFRWRDLIEDDEQNEDEYRSSGPVASGHRWISDLAVVRRLVQSPLNPLKVCSVNVVEQFARVAQHVGFVYIFPILEANKRAEYSSRSGNSSPARNGSRQDALPRLPTIDVDLTTFFPFDPYKLPRSSPYIDGIYRTWASVAIDDEDAENSEDEESEDEEANEQDEDGEVAVRSGTAPSSLGPEGDGLGESLKGMSISPTRPRQFSLMS